MKNILVKLGTASTASLVVCEAINLEPLINALITFAISVLSVLTVEGIAWFKSWLVKKIKQNKGEKDTEENKEE